MAQKNSTSFHYSIIGAETMESLANIADTYLQMLCKNMHRSTYNILHVLDTIPADLEILALTHDIILE